MNKSFTFASLITAVVLVLAYLGYIPSFISVTISLCVFVIALSTNICNIIRNHITEIKVTEKNYNDLLIKSFDNLYERLDKFVNLLEESKTSTSLKIDDILSILKLSPTQEGITNVFSHEITILSSKLEEHLKNADEKNDSYLSSLKDNSNELSNLKAVVKSLNEEIQKSVQNINNTSSQNTENFKVAVNDIVNSLKQNVYDVVSELSTLKNCVDKFTEVSLSVKDTNTTLTTEVTNAINVIKDSMSSISRDNRRYVDELKDVTTNNINDFQKIVKEFTNEQNNSISEGEDKIKQSINKLCNSLTSMLQKLEIDVDAICDSVENMKQLCQNVEKSDQELLTKVLKSFK